MVNQGDQSTSPWAALSATPSRIPEPVTSLTWMTTIVEVPPRPRDLGNGAGNGTPAVLGVKRLLRTPTEDGYVLACEGVDAFEGPAVCDDVP